MNHAEEIAALNVRVENDALRIAKVMLERDELKRQLDAVRPVLKFALIQFRCAPDAECKACDELTPAIDAARKILEEK